MNDGDKRRASADARIFYAVETGRCVCLLDAVKAQDAAAVRRLLHVHATAAEVAAEQSSGPSTPALVGAAATSGAGALEGAAAFIGSPADPNSCDTDGSSALHWAAWCKNVGAFSALLRAGTRVDCVNARGESVLEWALRGGDLSILGLLLQRPSLQLDTRNAFGGTAMHIAAEEGIVPALASLLLKGGNIDARDARGKTPLMCAAHRNKPAAVQWLLRHGASASIKDVEKASALHYAAIGGNEFACRQILQAGLAGGLDERAFAEALTPEELATKYNHGPTAMMLFRWGVQSKGCWNRTFLRLGLDPPPRSRPRLTGTQIYFFISISIVLLHFGLIIQPTLSSPLHTNLSSDSAYGIMLWIIWLCATMAIVGMGGFMYLSPGIAPKGPPLQTSSSSGSQVSKQSTAAADNEPPPAEPNSIEWLVAQTLSGASVCVPCRIVKPIRSKHCTLCGGCVLRMDHHCPWVNSCVGVNNHRSFMLIILSMLSAASCHAYLLFFFVFVYKLSLIPAGTSVWSTLARDNAFALLSMIHSILIVLGCLALGIGQSYTIAHGLTTNEAFNKFRYSYLANNGGSSPFSQGILGNCLAFWGLVPGRSFVREGQGSRMSWGRKVGVGSSALGRAEGSVGGHVVVDMTSLENGAHGHSHGGQPCAGHGHGASNGTSSMGAAPSHEFHTSPPAPSGSLHLQALLHPPHGSPSADDGTEGDVESCAFLSAPLAPLEHNHAPPQPAQQTYAPQITHLTGVHADGGAELEAVGLLSGKHKHR